MIQWLNTGVMQVTGTASAVSLVDLMNTASAGKGTAALGKRPNYVTICPEGAIRFTLDGQTPTTSVGLIGASTTLYNNTYSYEVNDISKVMIIGNTVKINIGLGFRTPG